MINNPLKINNGKYRIDLEDLEKKASTGTNRIMILCNPHNPVGRVWIAEEIRQVSDICIVNNVLLLSDEIHADIIFPVTLSTVLCRWEKNMQTHPLC